MRDERPEKVKEISSELFRNITGRLNDLSEPEQLEVMGSIVGLYALAIERMTGVDRAVVFKMVQRNGYAVIKAMEEKIKNKH